MSSRYLNTIKRYNSQLGLSIPNYARFLQTIEPLTKLKIRPIIFFFLCATPTYLSIAQVVLRANETHLYSFKTNTGKTMLLTENKTDHSVCYRYGSASKTELEYTNDAEHQIKYSFYLRGGGPQNEGMDLNYVYFTNNNFQYVLFDTYDASSAQDASGIKIIDLKTKKTTLIKAYKKSIKGNLIQFRDNQLLKIGEELFD